MLLVSRLFGERVFEGASGGQQGACRLVDSFGACHSVRQQGWPEGGLVRRPRTSSYRPRIGQEVQQIDSIHYFQTFKHQTLFLFRNIEVYNLKIKSLLRLDYAI